MHTPVNLYSILVGCKGDWRFGVVAGLFGGYAGERFAGRACRRTVGLVFLGS